jgi:multisubunit Na+/H+ antiporter MnhC subunit
MSATITSTKSVKFILGYNIIATSLFLFVLAIGVVMEYTSQRGPEGHTNPLAFVFGFAVIGFWLWLNCHAYKSLNKLREEAMRPR